MGRNFDIFYVDQSGLLDQWAKEAEAKRHAEDLREFQVKRLELMLKLTCASFGVSVEELAAIDSMAQWLLTERR